MIKKLICIVLVLVMLCGSLATSTQSNTVYADTNYDSILEEMEFREVSELPSSVKSFVSFTINDDKSIAGAVFIDEKAFKLINPNYTTMYIVYYYYGDVKIYSLSGERSSYVNIDITEDDVLRVEVSWPYMLEFDESEIRVVDLQSFDDSMLVASDYFFEFTTADGTFYNLDRGRVFDILKSSEDGKTEILYLALTEGWFNIVTFWCIVIAMITYFARKRHNKRKQKIKQK